VIFFFSKQKSKAVLRNKVELPVLARILGQFVDVLCIGCEEITKIAAWDFFKIYA
jgi:hypothetical protein